METDNPFERVLDRLREKGWSKGWSGITKDSSCIMLAAGRLGISRLAMLEIYPIVLAEHGFRSVAEFNDHPDTTFADVERVLEKAAVKWEEERVLWELITAISLGVLFGLSATTLALEYWWGRRGGGVEHD